MSGMCAKAPNEQICPKTFVHDSSCRAYGLKTGILQYPRLKDKWCQSGWMLIADGPCSVENKKKSSKMNMRYLLFVLTAKISTHIHPGLTYSIIAFWPLSDMNQSI